jgi:glucosylceramidase
VKFLDEYRKLGVTFWAVTAQNEPIDGRVPGFAFNCMGWTAEEQRDFIKNNLGPAITASQNKDTKIIILDDQRAFIVSWANTVLSDPEAAKYVSGIGVHWYMDLLPPSLLSTTHYAHPNYFILGTEACTGALPWDAPVKLGSWHRGELYADDIIQDLNHFVAGWTDWNLVLDMKGGPNWEGNTVDAPIIADNSTDQIYKQPMYYALGHITKFVPEDSVRIDGLSPDLKKLAVLTVLRPDGIVVAVILNQYDLPLVIALEDEGKVIEIPIAAHSIHTVAYTP